MASQNRVGQLTPLHATSSGKVLLAHLDSARQAELIGRELDRFTPHTHHDLAELETTAAALSQRMGHWAHQG